MAVPGPNNTNVDVQVTVPNTDPNNGKGSSDAVNKCFENAITSPLFYLLPIGILGAVAGNLAAPYMTEVNNQLNSLARQFNSDVNFDFGLGNNGWDNSTNNYNQFGAIGEQFGAFMNDRARGDGGVGVEDVVHTPPVRVDGVGGDRHSTVAVRGHGNVVQARVGGADIAGGGVDKRAAAGQLQ